MSGGTDEGEMRTAPRSGYFDVEPFAPAARERAPIRPANVLRMILVNGERAPSDALHLSALDRGFTLADGIFETMLVRHGEIFRASRHVHRLYEGARVLRIDLANFTESWLVEAALATKHELGMEDAAIRLTVSRGPGGQGLAPRGAGGPTIHPAAEPTVVVSAGALPEFPVSLYEKGLSARTASARRDERALTAGVKTLAYTETIAALARARDEGADEVIFLDTEGHVSEASASNVFIVSGGALVTPPLSCAVLPGITREAIIELAAALDIPVLERPVEPGELHRADEIFLTSSLRGLAPLVRVDGRVIGGAGEVGPLTRRLRSAYADLVENECGSASRQDRSVAR